MFSALSVQVLFASFIQGVLLSSFYAKNAMIAMDINRLMSGTKARIPNSRVALISELNVAFIISKLKFLLTFNL
jgi:hypothetical protein